MSKDTHTPDPRADEAPLMSHEYDGIREYDNPLPGWWSGIFVLTVIFAGVYWYWYHAGGPGKSIHEKHAAKMQTYLAEKAEYERTHKFEVNDAVLADLAADVATLDAGGKLFMQHCVGCHLADGSGQTGPNLTDEYQIHGSSRLDLYTTIRDGVPAKGMISWGATMKERDMAALAVYVAAMRGKNLPGKVAEGGKVGAF